MERINQFLARRGIASRRGADKLILDGLVMVNGRPAIIGLRVESDIDVVTVDGQRVSPSTVHRTVMLNKPIGVITSKRDTHQRSTVIDIVGDATGNLFPVGRLDMASRGLLLLTTDGELGMRLMHPRYQVEKHYYVRVKGKITVSGLRQLIHGITLEDGLAISKAAEIVPESKNTLRIVISEGKNHEVRRICAAIGLDVVDLQRSQYGPLQLGKLKEGGFRNLRPRELSMLYQSVGL